jgi:hypothetical protein
MNESKVRAQYHFRMSPQGLCAWDVRRLIELSRSFPVERVPLSEIRELDEPYWAGDGDQKMTCRDVVDHARLISECDLAFPVILSSDGRVMDGMHRICKALLLGQDAIDAVRFRRDPEPDHIGVQPEDLPYED